jgi:outer membrane protein
MLARKHKRYFCLLWSWMAAAGLLQGPNAAGQNSAEPLTLEKSIELAMAHNRSLAIAGLEIEKSKAEASQFKTKRLPTLSTTALGSELLTPISFTFEKGVFGNYPGVGPLPGTDTKITTPRQPSAFVQGQVSQPLSQLYAIRLGIHAQDLNVQLSSEKARAQRQSVIRDVKQAYYAVAQSESTLEAAEATLTQYRELDRVVLQRVSQEAALQSDSLDVKVKLADQEYQLVQLRNTLQSRKEYLNELLGRDIGIDFQTEHVPPVSEDQVTLERARERTMANSPEIRQASLNAHRAEYDRRIARADYIPSVVAVVNYISPFNVEMLPQNVASVGVEVKWEPWDWGRRRDAIREKAVVERQAGEQLRETQSKALLDVNSRFRKLEEARALIAVAQTTRQASFRHLQEITNKYEQRTVLLSDVLQQQALTAAASDKYQQALLGFWSAQADFEKSMGEDQ